MKNGNTRYQPVTTGDTVIYALIATAMLTMFMLAGANALANYLNHP